ncbi:MAG: sigma 54-interacting transcriptional regulator [Tissierellia bacterium]|nr:sigma 54-interacting transcriptional regulator [Tissierellia bacterium]
MTIKLEFYDITEEAFDNLFEAICICDSEGKVIYWNKSSEKLYNIKKEDIIGTVIDDSFPNALMKQVFHEKKPIKNIIHQPVEGKSVVVSAIPIFNSQNKMTAIITTDRDITEVVNLSEMLKKEKEKSKFYESQYKEQIAKQYSFSNIITKNKKIIEAVTLSERVSPSKANIMITGESGTGKDVFARAIHGASGRQGRFVAVNCSAIPDELLESELFGYESGAFTGASKGGKQGKFELADKGTLFLDEIGDMPMRMQSKLLRVLQDGIVTKLGSEKSIETDVRIIAATNKNLREEIDNDKFRKDLFYRLAVVSIDLPPLRERKEDIRELTKFFIKEFSKNENIQINGIDEEIYNIFENYSWEGNIRELKNVIQRIVILSNDGKLRVENIPSYITKNYVVKNEIKEMSYDSDNHDFNEIIRNIEIKLITDAMIKSKGNKSEAAKYLNVNRSTLYYKLGLYNLKHLEQ